MTSKQPNVSLKSASTSRLPLSSAKSVPSGSSNVSAGQAANARKGANTKGVNNGPAVPPGPSTQKLLDKDRKMVEYSSPADKCPVCFSDRYLNPSLRLLVSKCYHKMCESCIDRIFTLGPGPCPVCGQIVRKTQFTPQTYEDLNVEKEVTIRKRIAKIFNKTEEDFLDLRTYNDYLQDVEDLTFNLINQVDVEETDRRIAAYQRENAEQIDQQSSFEDKQAEMFKLRDEEERRERMERTKVFAQQDEQDKLEKKKFENDLIEELEKSESSAADVIKKQKAVALKRSSARGTDFGVPPNTSDSKPSLMSKYLSYNRSTFSEKEKDPYEPEDPLVDYDASWYDYRDLFTLRGGNVDAGETEGGYYRDQTTTDALHDAKKLAGGFNVVQSVWERAVRSAVMGLWTAPLGGESGSAMQVD